MSGYRFLMCLPNGTFIGFGSKGIFKWMNFYPLVAILCILLLFPLNYWILFCFCSLQYSHFYMHFVFLIYLGWEIYLIFILFFPQSKNLAFRFYLINEVIFLMYNLIMNRWGIFFLRFSGKWSWPEKSSGSRDPFSEFLKLVSFQVSFFLSLSLSQF